MDIMEVLIKSGYWLLHSFMFMFPYSFAKRKTIKDKEELPDKVFWWAWYFLERMAGMLYSSVFFIFISWPVDEDGNFNYSQIMSILIVVLVATVLGIYRGVRIKVKHVS